MSTARTLLLEVNPAPARPCFFQCAWPLLFYLRHYCDEHTRWPPEKTSRSGKHFQQRLRRSRRGQADEAKFHTDNAELELERRWSSRRPRFACGDSNGRRLESSIRPPRPRRCWEWRLRRLKSTEAHSTGGSSAPGHQGPCGEFSVWRLRAMHLLQGPSHLAAQLAPLDARCRTSVHREPYNIANAGGLGA